MDTSRRLAAKFLSTFVALVLAVGTPLAHAQSAARALARPVAGPSAASGGRVFTVKLPDLTLNSAAKAPSLASPGVALPSVPVVPVAIAAGAPQLRAIPALDAIAKLEAAGVDLQGGGTPAEARKLLAAAEALPSGPGRDNLVLVARSLALTSPAEQASGLAAAYDNAKPVEAAAPVAAPTGGFWGALARSPLMPPSIRERAERLAKRNGQPRGPKPVLRDPSQFEVPVAKLRWVPGTTDFPASTRDLPEAERQIVGQDKALAAMEFGLRIPGEGYNLYISGPDGSGRETALRQILERLAPNMATPPDLVAVTNFQNPDKPLVLELPSGSAPQLAAGVKKFVRMLQAQLPKILNSGELLSARKTIAEKFQAAVTERQAEFDQHVAGLTQGRFGVAFIVDEQRGSVIVAPTMDGTTLSPDEAQGKIAAGELTQADWDAAKKRAEDAMGALMEKFMAMTQLNAEHAEVVQNLISTLNAQAGARAVKAFGRSLFQWVDPAAASDHDDKAHQELEAWSEAAQDALREEAAQVKFGRFGVVVEAVPMGEGRLRIVAALTLDGKPLNPQTLHDTGVTQDEVSRALADLEPRIGPLVAKLKAILEEQSAKHAAMHAGDKDAAVSPETAKAILYVESLLEHAAKNLDDFLPAKKQEDGLAALMGGGAPQKDPAEEYKVSVLAANKPGTGAPVIYEKSPSYENLFGAAGDENSVMMVPGMGLVKEKSPGGPSLKGGAFHRANGGFLVLDIMDVLREPGAWQGLMRAVRTGQAEITEGGPMGFLGPAKDKHAVASKVKVVFIGSPMIRMILDHYDEDFARNFKARADFESTLKITPESVAAYLSFFKKMVAQGAGQVLDMAADAMGALLEFSARAAESNGKLSAQFGKMLGLIREASYWAKQAGRDEMTRADVDAALEARKEGMGSMRRRLRELYEKKVFRIDTEGSVVGQINGLAVMGDFGVVTRVSVVTSPGKPGVISVDRDSDQSGPSFNKALGIVEGFIEHTFGQEKPLSAHIRISFEQSYGGIDGDSATSTEIYAILSSLSGVPIQQRFAVTGSADQFGAVQAIGGANEKTEGFFGLTAKRINKAFKEGAHAVIVPRTNVDDLMLEPEVIQAVAEGRFKVYSVNNVGEGIELLTGVPYAVILEKAAARLEAMRQASMPAKR